MTVNNTTTKGKDMTIKRLRLVYRVYFQHPTLNISHQDVEPGPFLFLVLFWISLLCWVEYVVQ